MLDFYCGPEDEVEDSGSELLEDLMPDPDAVFLDLDDVLPPADEL